jgi:Glu-tRNA(Gln) amidotransferase subunit E-like FAD-binding protein
VRQAALETVIAWRMRIRATISIHHARLAGVSVSEIAHVLGSSHADVAQRWRDWAQGQLHLNAQCPGLGISQREYKAVTAVIEAGPSDQGGEAGLGGCACQGMDTQIGSPRP